MNLLSLVLGRKPEKRYSLDSYAKDLQFMYNGHAYAVTGSTASPWLKQEDVENSFTGYVQSLYKSDGVVFACMMARLRIFAQARFQWTIFKGAKPGPLFGNPDLRILEKPWPNGSTSELLARMIQDADLAGQPYIAREGKRLRRLRPDWVSIILTAPPAEAVESDVAGYLYRPGGLGSSAQAKVYLPDEVMHWCADEQTEILTAGGWKDFRAVSTADEVLTLNHDIGMSEWQQVEEVCIFPAQPREMVLMEGKEFSSLTTLNHRWPVERKNSRAKKYERRWATSATLSSGDRIPVAAYPADVPSEQKWSDDLVEIVGWFWTEGSFNSGRAVHSQGRSVRIGQSYKNGDNVARIRAALTGLFGPAVERMPRTGVRAEQVPCWRESRDDDMVIFSLSANASDVVTEHAPAKVVATAFLRSLTKAQLDLFIKVSLLADNNGRFKLAQKSPAMAEQFALACILAGHGVTIRPGAKKLRGYRMTNIRMLRKRHIYPQMSKRVGSTFTTSRVMYDGHVWCPRTPNQTWLARRNGAVYFTGNSPIPDPEAQYRGMSWLTPVLREIQGDKAASLHKLRHFENSARPHLAVSFKESVTQDQFKAFMTAMNQTHQGPENAGKTLYLGGGADVTVLSHDLKQLDYKAVTGAGEPLALDTPIPTPAGWTTMGEIAVGDLVFGRDGLPCRVMGVSPVHEGRPCYRVTFADRTSIVADAGHLWTAMDRATAAREERQYTTEALRDMIAHWAARSNGGNRIGVPPVKALKLPDRDLLVDPYVLGAWLGDGQTAGAAICGADADLNFIAAEIEHRGYSVTRWASKPGKVGVIGIPGGLRAALDAIGVLGAKSIPGEYLRASYDQRLDLLRGLMDTDGSVGSRGKETCEYSSKLELLARQVAELARSLGFRTTVTNKKDIRSRTGLTWRVTFRADPEAVPFLLPRKAARCVTPLHVRNRAIVSIEPVPSVPVRCIAVDGPDHLFVAGEGWTLTHNTRIANAAGVPAVIVGLSEGLQGSSLNAGNYSAARRNFADSTLQDLWISGCSSLETVVPPPSGASLWFDKSEIPFLREDAKDAAGIIKEQMLSIESGVRGGYDPDTVVTAVHTGDLTALKHTGLYSVQLQPAGTGTPAPPAANARPRGGKSRTFDPLQPRDEHGKWNDFGMPETIVKAVEQLGDSLFDASATKDDKVVVGFGAGEGRQEMSLGRGRAWRDFEKLVGEAEDADIGETFSVIRRKEIKDADGETVGMRSEAVATITVVENDRFEVRLGDDLDLGDDEALRSVPAATMNGEDLRKLSDQVGRVSAASRVKANGMPVDVYIAGNKKFGLRVVAKDGVPVEVALDPASWQKMRLALDVVIDGFDELGTFDDDLGPDDEGLDDDEVRETEELDIVTNAGELTISHVGERGESSGLPGRPQGTFSIAAYDGTWEITWPAAPFDHDIWDSFDDVEGYASEHDWIDRAAHFSRLRLRRINRRGPR